jgi:GDP-mannose 6-dehydrogenase
LKVAVFGLGYVGSVTAACLARMGHAVVGVDVSEAKVRAINAGRSPILERGLDRLVARGVRHGRLRATSDAAEALRSAQLSMICVGTPSRRNGRANLEYVRRAVREIGAALRGSTRTHLLVLRSTVPPGTTESLVIPELRKASGRKTGGRLNVCFQPEFLREGSSVEDFFNPPRTVIGADSPRTARLLVRLWKPLRAPLFVTSCRTAELVKYLDNAFHALKIGFANEVGALAEKLGVDALELMRIFVTDRKLNISPAYLRPGFAFGGPCLPKDLRSLEAVAGETGVEVPLLSSVLVSNARRLERAVEKVLAAGRGPIGVLGLAFKPHTDDLRESPAVGLVRRLLDAGRRVKVFDPQVRPEKILGANREYAERALPELPKILVSRAEDLLAACRVIVVAGGDPKFRSVLARVRKNQVVVDLVGLTGPAVARPALSRKRNR